jgi:two-component system OmpR family sensor kinase
MTLRVRVVAGLAVIALLIAIGAFTVTRTTRSYLVERLDAQLTSAASMMTGADADQRGEARDLGADTGWRRLTTFYVGYLGSDGELETVFAPDLSGSSDGAPVLSAQQASEASATGAAFTSDGTGTSDYRVRAISTGPHDLVIVALPLDSVDTAMSQLVGLELVISLVSGVVLVMVGWWVLHLGIRPLRAMATTAAHVAQGDLSARVPQADPSTEAGELGVALNRMIINIEEAFDARERSQARLHQFVADASHELRTPVATIRGYAELYRKGALTDRDRLDDAMRRTEREAIRMGALVDDLLLLARMDEERRLQCATVDLAALAQDAARDAHALDPARTVTAECNAPVYCTADSDRLRQVFANLTRNAIAHTPAGSPIEVHAEVIGDQAVVEVVDHGPGIDPAFADRVFERFARVDAGRSRDRGGSGLGLAIVRAIVEAHDGTVSIGTTPGGGATATVRLPLGPPCQSAAGSGHLASSR